MLNDILQHKRAEIERLHLPTLRRQAMEAPPPRAFLDEDGPPPVDAGSRRRVKLIAEIKLASPSRGLLAPQADVRQLAHSYVAHGADALSIVTDHRFFLGELETLSDLRFAHALPRPLLRKDFILAPVQVYETRAAGADAILLIVAALPEDARLADLHALALDLGLTPLVEVHSLDEVERALRLPSLRWVGINNRDLRTFSVSLETTLRLRPHLPPGLRVASESGIFTAGDVARLAEVNVDAVLVGEALVTAPDVGAKVRELSGVEARAVAGDAARLSP